jgi:hypothetical protein
MVAEEPASLFEADGTTFMPTLASAGPWHEGVLHGGAVAALLAGLLEDDDRVLARILIELLGPVPSAPLRAELGPVEGGRRVVRQAVELTAEGKPVARAHGLRMRRTELDLPAAATEHRVVFDPADRPELVRPNRGAMKATGRESFDSLAMSTWWEDPLPEAPHRRRYWQRLLLPVVQDRPASAIEQVAAAADFSSGGIYARLGMRSWSFMSTDLVVALGRPPVGDWVGLECDGILGRTGSGQSTSTIHDADGPLGQASQSVLLEPRPT